MYNHCSSVYNNSCLKTPKNPRNDKPLTVYEQKILNDVQNQVTKFETNEMSSRRKCDSDKETLKSFLEFYDSIPEYEDINHLSNKEFYKKLENLKEKQKSYYEFICNEFQEKTWVDDYKKLSISSNTRKKPKPSIKPCCTTPSLNKSPNLRKNLDDVESLSFSDKEILKPPSRRSVRIETPSEKTSLENTPEPQLRPKSRANLSSAESYKKGIEWDDLSIEDFKDFKLDLEKDAPYESKSVPNSPRKSLEAGITIPKPFQMTVRDEENKIVEDILIKMNKPKPEKPEHFKAHDIPIESQIPLFDKIMEDQEHKNFRVRERRKAALNAQMRPFSFTKRDEEIQALTKQFSKSSPSLYLDDPPLKIKKFKAKPIPKNLFSNYIYKKMHEDEFYRALQKKIRAEEMLRAASLPPSMAKREKSKPKLDVCPRSFRELSIDEKDTPKKKKKESSYFKLYQDEFDKELEELKKEFIGPKVIKKRRSDKKIKRYRQSSASSKSSDTRTNSSLDLQSINRSNLAAVLRIQSARRRLEMEMCRKLEESKLKEESRWREKIMRKKPVWEALAYSHEEDLAMRLQLRREEEKLRNEEHHLRMQMMLGRVNQQPTLFERQSMVKCPKTKEELMECLHKEYGNTKRSPIRSLSDLSDIRSVVEMKDEAIQAFLNDNYKCLDSEDSKESCPEDKEKCDCFENEK